MTHDVPLTKAAVFEHVARSLREFGYPTATAQHVQDVWEAMQRGTADAPHGVIGMFARSQLKDVQDALEKLP